MREPQTGVDEQKTRLVLELSERALARADRLRKMYASQTIAGAIENMFEAMASDMAFLDRLTARQRQVLMFICEGLTTKQIAGQLEISVKTVEAHRTQLLKIVNARSVAGLVRFAIRAGLIQP